MTLNTVRRSVLPALALLLASQASAAGPLGSLVPASSPDASSTRLPQLNVRGFLNSESYGLSIVVPNAEETRATVLATGNLVRQIASLPVPPTLPGLSAYAQSVLQAGETVIVSSGTAPTPTPHRLPNPVGFILDQTVTGPGLVLLGLGPT